MTSAHLKKSEFCPFRLIAMTHLNEVVADEEINSLSELKSTMNFFKDKFTKDEIYFVRKYKNE